MRMTPRQLKLGSLPRDLFSFCELRSNWGITTVDDVKNYHEQIGNAKWGLAVRLVLINP
jgi:hypothetical protein